MLIDQERKLRDRRRSDTVVVSTINYANQGLGAKRLVLGQRRQLCNWFVVSVWAPVERQIQKDIKAHPGPLREINECLGFGGSMVARLKLKGIDGRAPPGVEPAA